MRLATFNLNSVYGRERDLNQFFQRQHLSIMACQEPKLFMCAPPQGLPTTSFCVSTRNQDLEASFLYYTQWAAQVNTQLPFCDAVFWIQVTTTMIKLNIGNSYWGAHPEERKHTENDVDTLIAHVLSFQKMRESYFWAISMRTALLALTTKEEHFLYYLKSSWKRLAWWCYHVPILRPGDG